MQFVPHKAYLRMLVQESLRIFQQQADAKEITVSVDIPRNLSLEADIRMLSAIIRNLLSNAIKFTGQGGTVTLEAQEEPDSVQFCVRDSGVGMKHEDLQRLFRIDVHHSTTGTDDEKGSGLGLILCKEFVEKHGGTITVESEQGQGSCFTVMLPKMRET
jgi:signal transduction histidine kinase